MARSERGYIFPSDTPNYSSRFSLERDLANIVVNGLQEGDKVSLEMFVGDECDGEYVPFAPSCCGPTGFCYPQNQLFLAIPNRYRLVFSNEDDNHLTDPAWFENVTAFYRIVESDLDISSYANSSCDCGCGLDYEDVKAIAEMCIEANAATDLNDISTLTGVPGGTYVHSAGGVDTNIEALDNGDGTAEILGCVVPTELFERHCIDGEDTTVVTDLKTNAVTTTKFIPIMTSSRNQFNFFNDASSIIDASTPDNTTYLASSHVFEVKYCTQIVQFIGNLHINNRLIDGAINTGMAFSIDDGTGPGPITNFGPGFSTGSLGGQNPLTDQTTMGIRNAILDPGTYTVQFYVVKNFNTGSPVGEIRLNQFYTTVNGPWKLVV